jgi:hypothetical protein
VITLRPPTLLDFMVVAFDLPAEDRELYTELTSLNYDPETAAAQMYLAGGRRWTFADRHNDAVAVGGYTPAGNDTWSSWFMGTSNAWNLHGRDVTARVRDCIAQMFNDPHVRRLETVTLATRTRARAWY